MPCVSDFGIIDKFEKDKDYAQEHAKQKYNCISIDDDFINDWWRDLTTIKTYYHCYDRPGVSLARHGVTLIPPESLEGFYEVVARDKRAKSSEEIIALLRLIRRAIDQGKYVIHYGV